jgi:photosystem II stability/assembly factor-like uncharacterized protein
MKYTILITIFVFYGLLIAQQDSSIQLKPTQYRRGTDLQKDYQTYEQKYQGKNLLEEKRSLYPLDKVTYGTGIWTELNPKVPRVDYLGIHFVNTDTGWACGDLGTVIKSTDGGDDWSILETPVNNLLLKIYSYNGQIVIATGYDGIILRSNDEGETFEQVQSGVGSGIDLWGVQMINDTLGWVCGINQTLLKTTDAGLSWQMITPGLNQHYWSINFLGEQYGMIACGGGKVLKTTDGGNSWSQLQAGDTRALYTIDIIDSLHIAAAGESGKMVYSEDGGINWTEHNNLGFYPEINCISFVNRDTGYVVGDDFGLRKTTNRGNSWFVQGFNDIGEYEVDLHGEGYGFAAGTSLRLDRTMNGFDNWQRLVINDNFVDVSFVNEEVGYIAGTTYTGWPFFKTTDGGESWFTVPNYPDSIMGNLSTVYFIDSLHGFLGGATLIYTTDGGESWNEANGITNSITKLFFINDQVGWAVGGPRIFKTTDGGINWFEQLNDIVAYFYSIFFNDSLNGWAVSPTYNGIYSTFNGGISWTQRIDIPIYEANDIYFSDSSNGWIISANDLYRTIDGGNNWILDPQIYTYTTHFETISNNHFIITGTNIYESIDTGQVWQNITQEIGSYFTTLQAPENFLAFSVGPNGLILRYIDTSYVPVEVISFLTKVVDQNVFLYWVTVTETNNRGFEIQRASLSLPKRKTSGWEKIGFVEGEGSTTEEHSYSFRDKNVSQGKYRYRLKQIDFDGSYEYSKEVEVDVTIPNKFSLEQNYPNPFNPETNISFTIPEETNLNIKLYDITGREIRVLVNEKKQPGYYTIKLKGGELSSGVYFYRLVTSSGFTAVKKLIVLK